MTKRLIHFDNMFLKCGNCKTILGSVMYDRIDLDMLPLFMETKKMFVDDGSFDLYAYLQLKGNTDLAFAYLDVFWPHIICIDGCYLRGKNNKSYEYLFRPDMSISEKQSVEKLINHLHIYDLFPYDHPDITLLSYEYLAKFMLEMWKAKLHTQFPDVSFCFDYATEPDAYGPTIVFWHVE